MSFGLDPLRQVRNVGVDQYRAGLGEYLDAVASDAWAAGPLASMGRMVDVAEAGALAKRRGETLLTPKEASDRGRELGLRFEEPIAESAYEVLAESKRRQLANESVFKRARAEDGYGTVEWLLAGGTEFLTMAADPLNIASAFVPVVREARFAAWSARFGALPATLARGAIEGAAGQALLEPIIWADKAQVGDEYSMLDTLVSLSFGGGLGVVLHGAAYGAGAGFRFMRSRFTERPSELTDRRVSLSGTEPPVYTRDESPPPRQPVAEAVEKLRPETKDAALRTAIAQLVQDKPVDVEPVLRADPDYAPIRTEMDAAARADIASLQRASAESAREVAVATSNAMAPPADWQPTPAELKLAVRVSRGWKPEAPLAPPQSLVDFVRKSGGLIAGTAEAAELQASDIGRQPGLLRTRAKGRQADQMAQAARDAGYRLGDETASGSGINVDAFVKALIEDASGRTKHYPDDAHTDAWRAQQRYFDTFRQDLERMGLDPRGVDPRQLAWLLQQDADTARLMVLLAQIDQLGPEGSLELAARLDAERAALERQILADEPGRLETDAPQADHRDLPAATLAELESFYADVERAAGEGEAGRRAPGEPAAGERPPAGGEAAPARGGGRDDPAARAGLRREGGEEGPAAAEQGTEADLAGFAERQQGADLHANPAALAVRDERLAAEGREIRQLLDDDLRDFGHLLDDGATRDIFDAAGRIFDEEIAAVDALASCRIGGV